MTIQELMGYRIKELRIQKDMSQTVLAELVGYKDKTSIAKIEAGKVDLPQSKILAFANALNTTPSYLLNWSDSSDENGKNKVYVDVQAKNEQEAIYIAMKNMFIANGNKEQADRLTKDDAIRLYESCGFDAVKKVDNKSQTIAAHFSGAEYTDEELDEIKQFAEFVKAKRK